MLSICRRKEFILSFVTRRTFCEAPLLRYNTLTNNERIIVCHHPKVETHFSSSKPLGPPKPGMADRRKSLLPKEAAMVKQLRNEDPFIWTVNTLASLFNVSKFLISQAAWLSEEKREEIKKESQLLERLSFYKRKKYLEKREEERKRKLEDALLKINYTFPGQSPSN